MRESQIDNLIADLEDLEGDEEGIRLGPEASGKGFMSMPKRKNTRKTARIEEEEEEEEEAPSSPAAAVGANEESDDNEEEEDEDIPEEKPVARKGGAKVEDLEEELREFFEKEPAETKPVELSPEEKRSQEDKIRAQIALESRQREEEILQTALKGNIQSPVPKDRDRSKELLLDGKTRMRIRKLEENIVALEQDMDLMRKEIAYMRPRNMDCSKFERRIKEAAILRSELIQQLEDARQGYKRITPTRSTLEKDLLKIEDAISRLQLEQTTMKKFGYTDQAAKLQSRLKDMQAKRSELLQRMDSGEIEAAPSSTQEVREGYLREELAALDAQMAKMREDLKFMKDRDLDTAIFEGELKKTDDLRKELSLRLSETQLGIQKLVSRPALRNEIAALRTELESQLKEEETLKRFNMDASKARSAVARLKERIEALQKQLKEAEDIDTAQ